MEPAIILLFDGASGQHIPRRFAREIDRNRVLNVSPDDYAVLEQGPDCEWYWDTWQDVLDNAVLIIDGREYTLDQDGDVWALDVERMTEDERHNFGFEE